VSVSDHRHPYIAAVAWCLCLTTDSLVVQLVVWSVQRTKKKTFCEFRAPQNRMGLTQCDKTTWPSAWHTSVNVTLH